MATLKQPFLGVAMTALIVLLSLGFIALFSFPLLSGWVAYGLLCLIPMQIVVAVLWKGELPSLAAARPQPLRGLLQIGVTLVAGAIIGPVYFFVMGGGFGPPSPMLAQCTIVSVVVMFFIAIVWGGWPFTMLFKQPLLGGLGAWVSAYVINALLFELLFNYEFMEGAPVYVPSLDPHGMFNAWSALVFYVTALAVMFFVIHFDLWPLTLFPKLMQQPVLGVVWTAVNLAGGAALFFLGTQVLQFDPVVFLVTVPIPFIFGTIVVLNMLQNSLFGHLSQPLKGIVNVLAAAIIGSALAQLYRAAAATVTGPLLSGPPPYDAEIWLATALLSVTFPFLIFGAEFFKFWPLKKS